MMTWQCPACGASLTGQEPVCTRCGTPRPEFPAQPTSGNTTSPLALSKPPASRHASSLWALLLIGSLLLVVAGGIIALLAGLGVFNPQDFGAPPNTTGPGWWKANAPGLGAFQFHLNTAQNGITEFVFQIPKITCPNITYSATFVDARVSSPWPVQNGHFSADVEIDHHPGIDIEVSGAIASAGQQASGAWVFDDNPPPCQGTWTGVPSPPS